MDCKAPVSGRRGFRSVMAPIGASALAAVLALSCLGCSAAAPDAREDAAEAAAQEVLRANIDAMDFEYTKRDLDGSYDGSQAVVLDLAAGTVEGGGASYDSRDSLFSIEAEGTYLLQGAAEDVQVKVAVGKEEKVQLVLDGASLAASQRPALLVEEADKVFVTLAEGSQNSIAGGQADEGDSPLNGAVYSKADITFNGSGALAVEGQGQNCHAIASKDDLVITGGTYDLKAPGNGLHGKDCVKVCGGAFSIAVEGDGVRSSNDEDAARGFIAIDGGDFSIEAGDDGFSKGAAPGAQEGCILQVNGGTVLAEFAPANAYQMVVVSSAALALGDGFTLSSGGSSTQGIVAETSAGTGQGGPGDRGRGGAFGEEGGQGPAAPQGQGGPRDGDGSQRPQDMPEPPDGGDGFGEMQPPEGGEGGPGGPRSQEDGAAPQSREADATARGSAGSGEETIQA